MTQSVLICGGTGAIGREIVETLTGAGLHVAFTGRNHDRGRALSQATGAHFIPHSDTGNGGPLVAEAAERLGRIDGLVLNAGTIVHRRLDATSSQDLRDVFHVNVTVPVTQAEAATAIMPPGGSVVAVASNAGEWGESDIGAYSVSKAALLAACRALAAIVAPRGIRVNAVCPGDTEPGMADSLAELGAQPFALLPPLGRLGRPHDTAAAVTFLLSKDSSFITGASLLIDGGMHAALDTGRPR